MQEYKVPYIKCETYEELINSLHKYKEDILLSIIDDDLMIEKCLEMFGPTASYSESHGFSYGPYEHVVETDYDKSQYLECAERYFSDEVEAVETFIDSLTSHKAFVIDLLFSDGEANDSANELYFNGTDPISKDMHNFRDDIVSKLFDVIIW